MRLRSQSFFQSSGDGGGFTANPLDSRTFENTTVVGGTLLAAFGAGTAPVEAAWPGSGGGYFAATLIPSYQLPFAGSNTASSTLRNFPDVSMVAGNAACFFTTSGGAQADFPQIGTSISTPLFAAYMALVNQKSAASGVAPVGFANPVLYAIAKGSLYGTCFNDVLTGGNPQLTSGGGAFVDAPDLPTPATGFPAGTGYDLVTGLGSPTCTLITQLASPTPTVPVPPPTTPPTGPTTPPTGPTPPAPAALPFAGLGDGNSCGIVQGALECWGDNSEGQNATGDTSPHASPVCNQFSTTGTAAISVAVGDWHGCSVLADGTVWCWGGNRVGQVGPQGVGKAIVSTPVQVTGLPTTAKQVVAGGDTTCALLSDGTAWCWGLNNQGQFGNGTKGGFNDVNPNPTQVLNLPPASQLSIEVEGGSYLCALLQSGNVECWGGNAHLGTGSVGTSTTPKMVATFNVPLANVIQISTGGGHACALTQPPTGSPAHVLYCWGDNGDNELGEGTINTGAIPTTEVSPVRALELSGCGPSGNPSGTGCHLPFDVIAVACGGNFTCAVISDGTVRCLGSNTLGQLGNGATTVVPEDHPQLVSGLAGAVAVVASATGVCAQRSGGGLSCWGGSPLGNGTNGSSSTAVATDFKRCF